MTNNTVKQLATVIGISLEKLLEQLKEAGLPVTNPNQEITPSQKQQLLNHLQQAHKTQVQDNPLKKITLTRKSISELKVRSNVGKAKTVSVEVRRKRTYVKNEGSLIEEGTVPLLQETNIEIKGVSLEDGGNKAEVLPTAYVIEKPVSLTETGGSVEESKIQAELVVPEKGISPTPPKTVGKPNHLPVIVPDTALEEERKKKAKNRGIKEKDTSKYRHKEIYLLRENEESEEEKILLSRRKGKNKKEKIDSFFKQEFEKPVSPIRHEVALNQTITVAELASKMSIKSAEIIKQLMKLGVMATINQILDQDTATLLIEEMGHTVKLVNENALEEGLGGNLHQGFGEFLPRAPVVTIMGHVDHGKTSLLDYIRRTKVSLGEAGGITQHIGAYHVTLPKGQVTFLDTPGHSAFTAMRARGAKLTDIVVLVVAADDGVMPQTVEAIQHAQAAKVPLVVAINKIDKPDADLDRIKNELTKYSLVPEEWGGETIFVQVSAKTGQGIDTLLDSLLVQAEVLELKAPITGRAQAIVLESRLDKGQGPVASLLVQKGTLRKGDVLLVGSVYGRIRALLDENGKPIDEAGPSIPIEVLGLSGAPSAGDDAVVVTEERKARAIALFRESKIRDSKIAQQRAMKSGDIFSQLGEEKAKTLHIVLKADVQGSAEAIQEALNKLSTDEIKIKVVGSGVGGITESDVNLALASKALVLGFNVRADNTAKKLIEQEGLILQYHGVIYDLLDQVKNVMSGLLAPEIKEKIIGLAQVREVFRSAKVGVIAGSMVIEGVIRRNNPIRVLRDNVVVHESELTSLRRFKEDVNEVRSGMECGIGVKNFMDIRVNDQIEVFERVSVARSI